MMNAGTLTLILGPMFSGKSTLLLSKLHRYTLANKHALLIRPKADSREFLTHNHSCAYKGEVRVANPDDVWYTIPDGKYSCIGIDEVQFLDVKQIPFITQFLKNGISVIAAGLNGTSEQKPWPLVSGLIPFTNEIISLKAVCHKCGNDAPFTHCKTHKKEDVMVGDDHQYIALCETCWASFGEKRSL